MRFDRVDRVVVTVVLLSGGFGCSDDGPKSSEAAPSTNGRGGTHGASGAGGAGERADAGSGDHGGGKRILGGAGEGGDVGSRGSGAHGSGKKSFGGAAEVAGAGEGGVASSAGSGSGEEPRECEYRYTEGHGDLFVSFDGALRLKLRSAFDPNQGEILAEPESVCILVAEASRALAESYGGAPESEAFAFLGIPPGDAFWLLPEAPQVGIPWFGASTEGVPPTRYANEELHVTLAEVQAPEGGNVAVWTANFLGKPRPLFSTAEGELATRFVVGAHIHFNWSFSVAGEYRLAFRAEGTRTDGELDQSPLAHFRFLVGP